MIASTLFGSSITSIIIVDKDVEPTPSSTLTLFSTDVSAKFFNPAGCTKRLTEFTNLSHTIGLFIEYDKFW